MTSTRRFPPSFESGGATGELVRSVEWEKTPLGPIEQWPQSLKTTVSTLLHSRHPMFLWWGPELIQIYNDAYVPSFGRGKHPRAMGQRARECWPEVWSIISPQIDDVMQRAKASWHEDQLVAIQRNGRIEEVYWTYGYSPVFDDHGDVGGTLVVCTETTSRVLAERRFRTVRALMEQTALAMDAPTVVRVATDVFAEAAGDIPFAIVYLRDPRTQQVHLASSASLDETALPHIDRIVRAEMRATAPSEPIGLLPVGREAMSALPRAPWPEPVSGLYAVPFFDEDETPAGVTAFGLSAGLPFDEAYRAHLDGLVEHLGTAYAARLHGPPSASNRRVR